MKIQMWSDFRCPFCFIGKRNLEEALKQININAEIEMMSFELEPHFYPDKNKKIYESHAQKYNTTEEKSKKVYDEIKARAHEVGLKFEIDKIVDANTFNAHKILQLAKEKGAGKEFVSITMSAYFEKGENIDEEKTLINLAESVGLKKDAILHAINSDDYAFKVKQDQQWAQGIGARGVPHFVFDNKVSLSGAQPVQTFVEAINYTKDLKD